MSRPNQLRIYTQYLCYCFLAAVDIHHLRKVSTFKLSFTDVSTTDRLLRPSQCYCQPVSYNTARPYQPTRARGSSLVCNVLHERLNARDLPGFPCSALIEAVYKKTRRRPYTLCEPRRASTFLTNNTGGISVASETRERQRFGFTPVSIDHAVYGQTLMEWHCFDCAVDHGVNANANHPCFFTIHSTSKLY